MDEQTLEKRLSQIEVQNQDLQQRLRRSERRVRLMAGACALSLAVACIAGAMEAEDQLVVKDPNTSLIRIRSVTDPQSGSSGIEIGDKAGKRRIFLGTNPNDVPNLTFYGVNGNEVRVITP